jgi:hypothetical protein
VRQLKTLLPLAAVIALSAASPASSQGTDLKELLSGKTAPLSVKLKDLNADWRRMSIRGPKQEGGSLSGLVGQLAGGFMGAMFGGGGDAMASLAPDKPYYTQGQTLTLGSETYLVVYRPQTTRVDFSTLMKLGEGGKLPPIEKLTPDSSLSLSLLNIRNIESLSDIRPFNMEQEIAEAEKAAEAEAELRKQFEEGPAGLGGLGGAAVPEEVAIPEPPAPKPAAKPKPKPTPKKKPTPRRR